MSARGEPGDEDFTGQQPALSPAQAPALQPAGEDEFDVIETDDRGQPIGGAQQPEPQDTRLTTEEGGEKPLIRPGEGEGQQQPGGGRRPDEYQTRSTRRRREKDARQSEERARQELEAENRRLSERLTNLEGIVTNVAPRVAELGEANIRQTLTNIDQQLADENARYQTANRQIADAMSAADHEALARALEARDTALVRKTQLANTKAQVEIQLKNVGQRQTGDRAPAPQPQDQSGFDTRRQPQQPQPLGARAQSHIAQFRSDYNWYDPQARDMDSKTVMLLDNDIANRGFDPNTQDYWDELDRMMQERMPWRFQEERQPAADGAQQRQNGNGQQPQQRQQAQPQRRGPPVPAPSDRGGGGGQRRQVKIDPQRKEAMILSGSIDNSGRIIDKNKYIKQLKSYEQFDRENAPRGS